MNTDYSVPPENGISAKECLMRGAMAVAALVYAAYCFYSDDFYVFGKHSAGQHFHGIAAQLLEGALLFAACALLAPVIGFYDKNQVKPDYEKFRRWFSMAGYALMGLGLSFQIFKPTLGTSSAAWWILCGIVVAQLGRLPPSYARKQSGPTGANPNAPLPAPISYLASLLLGVVALLFFAFAVFSAFKRPDAISPASGSISLLIWLPFLFGSLFAAWAVSIVRRTLQPIEETENPEKQAIKLINVMIGVGIGVVICFAVWQLILRLPSKEPQDNLSILAQNKAEQAKYEQGDALVRATAHDFSPPLVNMPLQRSQAEVLKELQAQQHKMKCYGDLQTNEKIQKDNDYLCWFIIKTAFGSVPARMASVFFSKGMLTNIRIEFPETSIVLVHNYVKPALNGYPMQTLKELDWVGKQVIYWKTPTGTVTTSAATPKDQPFILLWSEK